MFNIIIHVFNVMSIYFQTIDMANSPNTSYIYGQLLVDFTIRTTNITREELPIHPITELIEIYMIPVLCCLGFIGNSIASIVFLQKPLRSSSCCVLLAARGFADNGFLSTLLVIWVSRTFELELGAISGTCGFIIYVSYVCGCMSVWLVVFVTFENYIRIRKPFMVNRYCTNGSAILAVTVLSAVVACLYCFPFWAMNPEQCIPYAEHYITVQAFIYMDSIITLVIPFLLISILMTVIVYHVIKSQDQLERRFSTSSRTSPNTMAKVTKLLFAVSLSFVCLSLPSHVYRLQLMVTSLLVKTDDQYEYSSVDEAVQQTTLIVYYMSLSFNIVVYLIFGSKFRATFVSTFCSCNRSTARVRDSMIFNKHAKEEKAAKYTCIS